MTGSRTMSVAAILAAALLAHPEAETSGTERRTSGGCSLVRVSSPELSASRRSRKRAASFSASEILDLRIEVSLSRSLKAVSAVELKLFTPKGHLYQTLAAAVSEDAERRGNGEAPQRTASALLPVAGTTIVTSSLYGAWRVEAHLEGQPKPCGRPVEFTIDP